MNQRGQVYPLFAFLILVFMAFASLGVDIGYYRYQQRLQQTATDSAALAGAYVASQASPNAQDAAVNDATNNGYVNGSGTVSVVAQATADAYTGTNAAVKVTITKNYPKFFSAFFGTGTQEIGTTAVAMMSPIGNSCNDSLNDNPASGTSSTYHGYNGPNCATRDNGCPTYKGTVDATSISYAGCGAGSPTENGNPTFPGGSPAASLPVQDTCKEGLIPGCSYINGLTAADLGLSCLPSATCLNPTCLVTQLNSATGHGCFSNYQPSESTLTGDGGIYVITNSMTLQGSFTATNVTFYVASGGITTDGCHACTLSAPTSGNNEGILFYQPTANADAITFHGTDLITVGLWYTPYSDVTYDGGTLSTTGDWIANSFTFHGNTAHTAVPGVGSTEGAPPIAVLAE